MSQPDPVPNDLPSMHDYARRLIELHAEGAVWNQNLLKSLEQRKQQGLETYGTLLQPFNGRDALQDAFEELLDALVYLRQALYEAEDAKDHDEVTELERLSNWTMSMCSGVSRMMYFRNLKP